MEHLIWTGPPPELRNPIMVCAFKGWNDAAGSATSALTTLADSLPLERVATVDPEEFFDFQDTRPTIQVIDGTYREIEWPETEILVATAESAPRDLIIVLGTEPNLRWRTYSETLLKVADELGVVTVAVLGALIADVAHTLPVPVTGLASDPEMVAGLELEKANYEGPTGIVGVIHELCRQREIPSVSLWAAIPHYVAAVPSPKAALSLVGLSEQVTGVAADTSALEREASDYEEQIDRAVAADSDIEEMVTRIEEQQRSRVETSLDVPSGEAIAREFQRFLRHRDSD
ncbi:MAG: PAC2 family protein [Solirubrobacterales bacterium]